MTAKVIRFRTRAEANLMSCEMLRGLLIEAYLKRGKRLLRTLCTVSVSFDTKLEAEEFYKLLGKMRRAR